MKKSMQIGKSTKLSIDSEVLFRRLLTVSRRRDVDVQGVLRHELSAVPPSLFQDDGTMTKTTKAELAKKLEATCPEVTELPQCKGTMSYIIDGMAMLHHQHEASFTTFEDLGILLLQKVIRLFIEFQGTMNVTIVFDRYDVADSIKLEERNRRGSESTTYAVLAKRSVPNYRRFLRNSSNKAALALFLSNFLANHIQDHLVFGAEVVLAGGFSEASKVISISSDGCREVPTLYSTHEEADTRMILHAVSLAKHCRVVVNSDDIDVLVLLTYYVNKGMLSKEVYMHTGKHSQHERFVPVYEIAQQLGKNVCSALPAIHGMTGCDSTSSFKKIGKRRAFTVLVQHADSLPGLAKIGTSSSLEDSLSDARQYALLLYNFKSLAANGGSLDEARYLTASQTDKSCIYFPPTEDAFEQHMKRVNYQCAIWCRSHEAKPDLWGPNGNGWKMNPKSDHLEPVMYLSDAAPLEVRDLIHLYCTDQDCDSLNKCPCRQSGLNCTDLCSCSGCVNMKETVPDEVDSEDEDDDDVDYNGEV